MNHCPVCRRVVYSNRGGRIAFHADGIRKKCRGVGEPFYIIDVADAESALRGVA